MILGKALVWYLIIGVNYPGGAVVVPTTYETQVECREAGELADVYNYFCVPNTVTNVNRSLRMGQCYFNGPCEAPDMTTEDQK